MCGEVGTTQSSRTVRGAKALLGRVGSSIIVVAAQKLAHDHGTDLLCSCNDTQAMVQDEKVELGVNSYTRRMVLARLDREGKRRGQRLHFF